MASDFDYCEQRGGTALREQCREVPGNATRPPDPAKDSHGRAVAPTGEGDRNTYPRLREPDDDTGVEREVRTEGDPGPVPTQSRKSADCQGEIIEVANSKVVCWLQIGERLRVRSMLDEALFVRVPKHPGSEFLWSASAGTVEPREFDVADLEEELAELDP